MANARIADVYKSLQEANNLQIARMGTGTIQQEVVVDGNNNIQSISIEEFKAGQWKDTDEQKHETLTPPFQSDDSVNSRENNHGTPLIYAVRNGRSLALIKELLNHGADPALTDRESHNAIYYALICTRVDKEALVNEFLGLVVDSTNILSQEGIDNEKSKLYSLDSSLNNAVQIDSSTALDSKTTTKVSVSHTPVESGKRVTVPLTTELKTDLVAALQLSSNDSLPDVAELRKKCQSHCRPLADQPEKKDQKEVSSYSYCTYLKILMGVIMTGVGIALLVFLPHLTLPPLLCKIAGGTSGALSIVGIGLFAHGCYENSCSPGKEVVNTRGYR